MDSNILSVQMGTIGLTMLQEYANASGDQNPIHLNEDVAREMGLPGIIVHGMLVAGIMSRRGIDWLASCSDVEAWYVSAFQCRFQRATLLGDTLSVGGQVEVSEAQRKEIALEVRNQKNELLITGRMTFLSRGLKE